jgi:hypothetical protein
VKVSNPVCICDRGFKEKVYYENARYHLFQKLCFPCVISKKLEVEFFLFLSIVVTSSLIFR